MSDTTESLRALDDELNEQARIRLGELFGETPPTLAEVCDEWHVRQLILWYDHLLADYRDALARLEAAERERDWYRINTMSRCDGCSYLVKYPVCTHCGRPYPSPADLAREQTPDD